MSDELKRRKEKIRMIQERNAAVMDRTKELATDPSAPPPVPVKAEGRGKWDRLSMASAFADTV